MTSLPTELYRPIIEGLDQNHLLTLVLVSRLFQLEAERLLFRKVAITSRRNIVIDCKHLLGIPRVLPYIQYLTIDDAYQRIKGLRLTLSFYTLLANLLESTTNLTSLNFRTPNTFSSRLENSCRWILSKCRFQLYSLECSFTLDTVFALFLLKQPAIIHLKWTPFRPSLTSLPDDALPNLAALDVSSSPTAPPLAHEFIPNRPVTHIRWRAGAKFILPILALYRVPLVALELHLIDLERLREISLIHPQLEYLGLVDLGNIWQPTQSHEVLDALSHLKRLHTIEVYVTNPETSDSSIATRLSQACPSLQRIMIDKDTWPLIASVNCADGVVTQQNYLTNNVWRQFVSRSYGYLELDQTRGI